MNSSSKDRIKLSIIAFFFLLVLFGIGYMTWGDTKTTGMYTGMVKLVNVDDTEGINKYKESKTSYAYKVIENDKFLLKYTTFDIDQIINSTLTLTNSQYNELSDNEYYWFKIKFSNPDDPSSGTVQSIYTESPTQK